MVPINPGVLPPTNAVAPSFDPYAPQTPSAGSIFPQAPVFPPQGTTLPPNTLSPNALPPSVAGQPGALPSTSGATQFPGFGTPQPGILAPTATAPGSIGAYPGYTGPNPTLPSGGQSAVIGTFPYGGNQYAQPGVYPSAPSSLFPGTRQQTGIFGGLFDGIFGNNRSLYQLPPQPGAFPPQGNVPPSNWNPQGSVFGSSPTYPQFIRFFQGPRFRHAFINGNDSDDALMINDSDLALAFAWPNFLFSDQPLYLMPTFSLHQWDGPKPPSSADLPALAYSAFLDTGWQSDPARILGAELGLRVGMFSDFDTATSDSLRVMGRAIGRIRVTPRATVKLGVLYLDRNRIKLLPAGGLLWQPNPDTRFDLFFPEPKLAHYLSTIGNSDTWWYVGGYYGGGSWTVQRRAGGKESIDINDLRLVLGLEWGRNDQMRQGRRNGFCEIGYVFDRELLYRESPLDNMDLQDTIMFRVGFGY
ncbi:MAG: hypothetical protein Aurels2KO_54450 [Aureliella sp.]